MESLCLQQDSAVSGKAIMGSQSPSADARPGTRTATPPARKLPDIHLDIVLVVFCGGAIGTAIRYAFAQIPAAGSFHTGTFVANMLACFCYAGLTAYLAGSSRFDTRAKELTEPWARHGRMRRFVYDVDVGIGRLHRDSRRSGGGRHCLSTGDVRAGSGLCVCRRVGRNASGRLLERIRRSVR